AGTRRGRGAFARADPQPRVMRTTEPVPVGFPLSSVGAIVDAYSTPRDAHSTDSAPGSDTSLCTVPCRITEIWPPNSSATYTVPPGLTATLVAPAKPVAMRCEEPVHGFTT